MRNYAAAKPMSRTFRLRNDRNPGRAAGVSKRRARSWLREQFAQERKAVNGDGVLGCCERAPDRGRRGDRLVLGGEGLDHDRTGVAGIDDRVAEADPVDVIGAWSATVVGRRVDVHESRSAEA